MTDLAPLTVEEVKRFMERWYLELLDTHAPPDELAACLAEDAEMRFPEVTVYGIDAFRDWYDRIATTFFDEVHTITRNDVTVAPDGQSAEVKVDVNWQAKVWIPPAAKSQWIGFDAGQTHEVRRSATTGEPMIQIYGVDTFVAMPGSSELPVLTREVIGQYYQRANAGDWAAYLELLDDDVVCDEQLAGHAEGKEVFKGAITAIERGYSKFQMHPLQIVVQGQKAAVMWHCDAANATGVPIDAIGVNYFEVRDGKITYMRTMHDSVPFKPYSEQKFD